MPRPARVLLVDDDEDCREMYGVHLAAAGYEVMQAENGAAAIEIAVCRKPDVVVMDLEMLVMNGLETVRNLRVEPRTRAIPVVLLSGKAVDPAEAKSAGCDACLAKPCAPMKLEGIIRVLVEGSQ